MRDASVSVWKCNSAEMNEKNKNSPQPTPNPIIFHDTTTPRYALGVLHHIHAAIKLMHSGRITANICKHGVESFI